jgi:NAD(P)H-dependent FMN reductase
MRRDSLNSQLIRLATSCAPDDLQVTIVDWIDQLPWMNPDLEDEQPAVVTRWQAAVAAADALLVGLPEYNGNPPALVKNAFDWATRPFGAHPLRNKEVAMISAAGRSGGARSQSAFAAMAAALGNHVVDDAPVRLMFPQAILDATGAAIDPEVAAAVAAKMHALLAALVARRSNAGSS